MAAIYNIGSGTESQASEMWYNISIVKLDLGTGTKGELMQMLLRYLATIWCLLGFESKL